MEEKRCSMCGKPYPPTTEYFSRLSRSKDGLRAQCKLCQSLANQIYWDNNKDKLKPRMSSRSVIFAEQNPVRFVAVYLAENAARRAKNSGTISELTVDIIYDWLRDSPQCPICKDEIVLSRYRHGFRNKTHNKSPTIDQIIPGMGYTIQNTILICHECNRKKQNWTVPDLISLTNFLINLCNERGIDYESNRTD